MSIRVTTYLDEHIAKKLDRCENKSQLVKEALNMNFLNKDYFIYKKKELEMDINELECQIENKKLKLEYINKEIEEIDKRKNERPDGYVKSVYLLKSLPNVTVSDLKFQAEKLYVDVEQLNEWLFSDGYYEEIFSDKKKEDS